MFHAAYFGFIFFFFKQKTAYEIRLSLVGSEMCIRDRTTGVSNHILFCPERLSVSGGGHQTHAGSLLGV